MDLVIAALGAAFILGLVDYFRWLGALRGLIAVIASVGLLQALGVTPLSHVVAMSLAAAFASMALLRALERMDRVTTQLGRPR
jgi:membrane protein implicated in regulation of membrane protease activity